MFLYERKIMECDAENVHQLYQMSDLTVGIIKKEIFSLTLFIMFRHYIFSMLGKRDKDTYRHSHRPDTLFRRNHI